MIDEARIKPMQGKLLTPFLLLSRALLDALWNGVAWLSKSCAPKVRADLYGVRS
jgi:hypothetical protein